jgi:ribosomal protein L37AE/L43A
VTYDKDFKDRQVGGDHYAPMPIQLFDIIDAFGLDFYEGNVLKYLLRRKDGVSRVEDLRKARHYLDRLIERHTASELVRGAASESARSPYRCPECGGDVLVNQAENIWSCVAPRCRLINGYMPNHPKYSTSKPVYIKLCTFQGSLNAFILGRSGLVPCALLEGHGADGVPHTSANGKTLFMPVPDPSGRSGLNT